MHCPYCGSWNAEDEPRCERCGRRLDAGIEASRVIAYPLSNSSAVPVPIVEPPAEPPPAPAPRARPAPRQPSLFAADRPKIIPFESISAGLAERQALEAAPVRRRAERSTPRRTESPARAEGNGVQPSLDFLPVPPPKQAAPRSGHHAAVAPIPVRCAAFLADAVLTGAGLGLFLLTFRLMGGQFVPVHRALYGYAAVAGTLGLFYRVFWCLLRRETPGMRRLGLRVVNFDGYPADGSQRLARFLCACLSTLAGLGLLWALFDEEKLSWHDHMSKTFLAQNGR